MAESTYSYSYSGSYTDDYSYSYSYSEDPSTKGDSFAERSRYSVQAAPSRKASAQSNQAVLPSNQDAGNSAGSEDSYSYSYSYSSSADSVTAADDRKRSQAGNWDTESSTSDSQTPEDEGSYSYSYSESTNETDPSRGQKMTKAEKKTMLRKGPDTRTEGPHDVIAAPTPPAVTSTAAAVTGDMDTGSYTYSHSRHDGSSYSYSYSEGDYYYSDGSYYYTDVSHEDPSSYYYSYSSSASNEKQKERKHRGRRGASTASDYSEGYSDSYYYSTTGSDKSRDYSDYYYSSYYTDEESYDESSYPSYTYSSYTNSETRHHRGPDAGKEHHSRRVRDTSSETYSATSKPLTSTTSSYEHGRSTVSLMSESETVTQREIFILRAPTNDMPLPPPAPKRCFVSPKSSEDAVWAFLKRLMAMQRLYEERRSAASASAAAAVSDPQHADAMKAKLKKDRGSVGGVTVRSRTAASQAREEEEEETLTPFIPTKDGCLSERSIRIAFGVLHMNHFERREALKNAPVPLPMATMFDIFGTCMTARGKERVAQAFLRHDTYRSGEISLMQLVTLLQRLGLGTSPIIEGFRINVGVSREGNPEMIVNVEQLVDAATVGAPRNTSDVSENASSATALEPSLEAPPQAMQWKVTPVRVLQIIRKNAAKNERTPVRWEHNTLFMGRHAIIRGVTTKTLFQRLKTHVEAATYLCVLAHVFSIEDAERGTLTVQYPPFIRSTLLPRPPPHVKVDSASWAAQHKLLYMENLFQAVFRPHEVLQAYEDGRPVPRYHNDWAIESTLHATNDTEEKRRRNVLPSTSLDNVHFIPATTARPSGEVQLSFLLKKVRVPAQPQRNARCFCLVSAVTPDNVFLPAIAVPVCQVVASSKKVGDYTWVFHDKKHKKQDAVLEFAGAAVDRIYVECCYETNDAHLPANSEGEAAQKSDAPSSTAVSTSSTIWCAGYVVFTVGGAKTAVYPIKEGSLLQEEPSQSIPVASGSIADASPPASTTATTGAIPSKPKKGLLRWLSNVALCSHHEKKNAPEKAHHIKVEVLVSKKPTPGVERLPSRYIVYRRHIHMISQLRGAVHLVGKETAYALQAFRQQAVRYIFFVAADPVLLDQLSALWAYRERHWSKSERVDEGYKQRTLLECVAALYALNNSCAFSNETFAKSLQKNKAHHMTIDPAAPMAPVRV